MFISAEFAFDTTSATLYLSEGTSHTLTIKRNGDKQSKTVSKYDYFLIKIHSLSRDYFATHPCGHSKIPMSNRRRFFN